MFTEHSLPVLKSTLYKFLLLLSYMIVQYTLLNPLTPRSDQHKTSPYNIFTLSSKQVMRILEFIR